MTSVFQGLSSFAPGSVKMRDSGNEVEIESLTHRKVSAKIIGVQHASKSLSCTSCKKKVTVKSNGKIANCQYCKMMMRVTSCQPQWFLKVLFQNTQNINDKLTLTLFNHKVDKLASFLPDVNLNIISEEDVLHFPSPRQ